MVNVDTGIPFTYNTVNFSSLVFWCDRDLEGQEANDAL